MFFKYYSFLWIMKSLFIIAQEGYQDTEYGTPKKILEEKGIAVITASEKVGLCHGGLGGNTTAQISLKEVLVSDYDLIVFIGGPGAVGYQHNVEAYRIAQEAVQQQKLLGAICIAPTILAYAGILKGRKATVWNNDGQQDKLLQQQGAVYTGETVTVDGKIVTANGPKAAEEFGKKLLLVLNRN